MAPFVGEYASVLDQKNRLIVPHKLREQGGTPGNPCATFVLVPGTEKSIFVYTPDGWQDTTNAIISGKGLPSQDLRRFQRRVGSRAEYATCDQQGRIIMPQKLREHAGLSREVTWVGAIDHAEIWDAQAWKQYSEQDPDTFDDIFDSIAAPQPSPRNV